MSIAVIAADAAFFDLMLLPVFDLALFDLTLRRLEAALPDAAVLVLAAGVVLEEAIDELADEFIDLDFFVFCLLVSLVTFDLVSTTFMGSVRTSVLAAAAAATPPRDDFEVAELFLLIAIAADFELVAAGVVTATAAAAVATTACLAFDFFDLKRSDAISAAALNMNKRDVGDFVFEVAAVLAVAASDELGTDDDKNWPLVTPDDEAGGATDGRCNPRHIKYFSMVLTAANGSTLTGPPFH